MGMSPKAASYIIAGIVAILLHGVTSFGFFIIPRLDDDDEHAVASGRTGAPQSVVVNVNGQQHAQAQQDNDGLISSLNPITGKIEFQRVIPISKTN
jgi:hypothetical protein